MFIHGLKETIQCVIKCSTSETSISIVNECNQLAELQPPVSTLCTLDTLDNTVLVPMLLIRHTEEREEEHIEEEEEEDRREEVEEEGDTTIREEEEEELEDNNREESMM